MEIHIVFAREPGIVIGDWYGTTMPLGVFDSRAGAEQYAESVRRDNRFSYEGSEYDVNEYDSAQWEITIESHAVQTDGVHANQA